MKRVIYFISVLLLSSILFAQAEYETDTIKTDNGDLVITFIGHGTLMFEYDGKVIHVDPVSQYANYSPMPKADIILITHGHPDHLEPETIKKLEKDDTQLVVTQKVYGSVNHGKVLKNGESANVKGLDIEAVPAYNIVNKRDNGEYFHPKGRDNGYVITFGNKKVYVAGDTEKIPEMADLKDIDIAFLPMNLPYTMTVDMAAEAARVVSPKILYPYHFGDSEVSKLSGKLADTDIEVRYRDME